MRRSVTQCGCEECPERESKQDTEREREGEGQS
eukprot:COSAG02_NODE_29338_length_571_cov_0.771186_3_plen_32_part_01